MLRKINLTLFAILAMTASQACAADESAKQMVRQTIDNVLAVIAQPEFKDEGVGGAKHEEVLTILLDVVDMDRIGALTLATNRRGFNDDQFKEFKDLLSRILFTAYISHLEKYSDEKVVIDGVEEIREDRVKVGTKTISGDAEIPVEFSLFKNENGVWKLYDVNIEGVSLVKNYRSQFKSMLMNTKPDEFLQELRNKIAEQDKQDKKESAQTEESE